MQEETLCRHQGICNVSRDRGRHAAVEQFLGVIPNAWASLTLRCGVMVLTFILCSTYWSSSQAWDQDSLSNLQACGHAIMVLTLTLCISGLLDLYVRKVQSLVNKEWCIPQLSGIVSTFEKLPFVWKPPPFGALPPSSLNQPPSAQEKPVHNILDVSTIKFCLAMLNCLSVAHWLLTTPAEHMDHCWHLRSLLWGIPNVIGHAVRADVKVLYCSVQQH
jgi:hypothetical protein